MRTLKTSEAAAFLNVSPNTLRSWERRFDFPRPRRSPGQHRLYTYGDISALRDALLAGLSISSAVGVARQGLRSGLNPLLGALTAFDGPAAEEVMESNLALRSVERSVEEVLLPALDQLVERHGPNSAPTAFANRWAGEWLQRAARFSYAPAQGPTVVIGDATLDEFHLDAVRIRAFELFCARSGPTPLRLSVRGIGSIAQAIAAHRPAAIVVAGAHAPDEAVARWAWTVRSTAGALPIALYRRKPDAARLPPGRTRMLPDAPAAAQEHLAAMAAEPRPSREGREVAVGEPRSVRSANGRAAG